MSDALFDTLAAICRPAAFTPFAPVPRDATPALPPIDGCGSDVFTQAMARNRLTAAVHELRRLGDELNHLRNLPSLTPAQETRFGELELLVTNESDAATEALETLTGFSFAALSRVLA